MIPRRIATAQRRRTLLIFGASALGMVSVALIAWASQRLLATATEAEQCAATPEPTTTPVGAFAAWARPGSPMDCLLTSQRARIAIEFGHQGCFSWEKNSVEIDVSDGTTIKATQGQAGSPFQIQGLPRELGLLHIRDLMGAVQRADTAGSGQSTTLYFARLSFWCDGVEHESIALQTREVPSDRRTCQWVGQPGAPYSPTHGVVDVAQALLARARGRSPAVLRP